MTTEAFNERLDRDAIAQEYRDAVADDELKRIGNADDIGSAAAYRLAVALGMRRLYGISLDEPIAPLSSGVALAAMNRAAKVASDYRMAALSIAEQWENLAKSSDFESFCRTLLESRETLLAVEIAVRETCDEAEANDDPLSGTLEASWEHMCDEIDAGDRAIEHDLDLLAAGADFGFLESRRSELAGEFGENPPWWLDGRLEEEARRVHEDAVATMPSAAAWRIASEAELERRRSHGPRSLAWTWLPERFGMAARAGFSGLRPVRWISPNGQGNAYAFPSASSGPIVRVTVLMNERRADLPQDSRICLGDVTGAVSQNGCVEFEANALWNAMENGLSDDLIIDSETWRRSEDDGDHETQGDVEHVEDHRQ